MGILSYPKAGELAREKAGELANRFLKQEANIPDLVDINTIVSGYLPLQGGTVKGQVVFTAGARFGPESLEVDESGLVSTSERIIIKNTSTDSLTTAGGITAGTDRVQIIDLTGRIPGRPKILSPTWMAQR